MIMVLQAYVRNCKFIWLYIWHVAWFGPDNSQIPYSLYLSLGIETKREMHYIVQHFSLVQHFHPLVKAIGMMRQVESSFSAMWLW